MSPNNAGEGTIARDVGDNLLITNYPTDFPAADRCGLQRRARWPSAQRHSRGGANTVQHHGKVRHFLLGYGLNQSARLRNRHFA